MKYYVNSFQGRFHPNNINGDGGIEIPEAWMPTIKIHNKRTVQQRTAEKTTAHRNNGRIDVQSVDLIAWRRLAVSYRNVTTSISRDYMHRETNDNTLYKNISSRCV